MKLLPRCRLVCACLLLVCASSVPAAVAVASDGAVAAVPNASFESGIGSPAGWLVTGEVRVEADASVAGKHALVLRRDPVELPATGASSGRFPLRAGVWELSGAYAGKLHSPDVSFNVAVSVPAYAAGGDLLKSRRLVVASGERPWTRFKERFDVPSGAEAGVIEIAFNKTHGEFRIDDLALTYIGASIPMEGGDRKVVFASNRAGQLFYPGDAVRFGITVETPADLEGDRLRVRWQVTDFHKAPSAPAGVSALVRAGRTEAGWNRYTGVIDLSQLPLQTGPYYELNTTLDLGAASPAVETASFAILPEPVTRHLDPLETPFGAHTWNATVHEYFPLAARLGIRRGLVFWRWPETAPYTPAYDEGHEHESRIGWPKRFGIAPYGVVYPVMWTEHRDGPLYTDEALREGTRLSIEKYKKHGLWGFQIGNEPPSWNPEWVKRSVEVYKVVYDEIKKTDPNFVAIGSAIGPNEAFFKAGFQEFQDVYNIHAYSDLGELRHEMRKYRELFKKYGGEKPIWSTEIGSKSQGLPRDVIANDIIRKAASFFADGGAFFTWFAVGGMPDSTGERTGSYSDSMDLFAGKFNMHLPRIDAIAYYHLINTLGTKTFVEERRYADGAQGFLFRDKHFNTLAVYWNATGANDVFLPLPGIHEVELRWPDGTARRLDARGEGITLRIGETPILVSYRDDTGPLPEKLDTRAPAVALTALPESLLQGDTVKFTAKITDPKKAGALLLSGPHGWAPVTPEVAGNTAVWSVIIPGDTQARALTFRIENETLTAPGDTALRFTLPVKSKVDLALLPAAGAREGDAAARLVVTNHSGQIQSVTWQAEVIDELPMDAGTYRLQDARPSSAHFTALATDRISLAPQERREILLPLRGTDRQTLYKLRATATDSNGNAVQRERRLGGFASVARTSGAIRLDGVFDEPVWTKAPVFRLDEARQFCAVEKVAKPWAGVDDLSGTVRYAWDDEALYLAVEVKDDRYANPGSDGRTWNQDGLQFLVDPYRSETTSRGRYDYSLGLGQKGKQVWCHMSGDPTAPAGLAPEIRFEMRRADETTGNRTYEVAIPWTRLAPFKPGSQANLGFTLVINEDDGSGRKSTIGWFGGVHLKEANFVGDLILVD